ncbi:flagellar basal body rod protein FlgB [bacterium]|nr:flagellar basal body rod protein FlgB [bacterium]
MFDATLLALQQSLDLRTKAHAIYSSNIANANVPGYKARAVDFQDRLKQAIDMSANQEDPNRLRQNLVKEAIKKVTAQVYEDPLASVNGDGNSVDVDKQMTNLAKNTIAYESAVKLISRKFALHKYVVSEGLR